MVTGCGSKCVRVHVEEDGVWSEEDEVGWEGVVDFGRMKGGGDGHDVVKRRAIVGRLLRDEMGRG
jgi:hypothetical protein